MVVEAFSVCFYTLSCKCVCVCVNEDTQNNGWMDGVLSVATHTCQMCGSPDVYLIIIIHML